MKLTYVGFSINIRENIRFLLNKTAGKVYYIFFTFAFSVRYNKSLLVLKKIAIAKYIIFVRKQIVVVEKNKNCLRYDISFNVQYFFFINKFKWFKIINGHICSN